ncbi:MAG: adenosylcobinamide-GDP ribazoletransferase [Hyphomicrobium sp.]|uniref:adenosylcobinamide-GDP ribazoletransferase n=1 Tax=Hyphomicrobium sp. TaxID=82 RepID=UPI0013260740|nr:adenosylcobinamide-GDP ribazoletransferase [Hyphomicrobium sp.]KAB2942613.1 MAG: adenosylcobinamide-GDP ribazoletransferase [Hyphomicrobium sp.]MBZ0208597.1 adenosylcobinamide-GDP ribazoletransferase [Hyphomicrobium sp.]
MSVNAQIRSFSHALQFLTRLPAPRVDVFDPADLSRSALWFPVVGIIVGAILAVALWLGALASPWIGALLALIAWVWVTGGLHLDGLGDVADALAGAHRSPERFLQILRDPHIGAFGAMAITLQLIAKLVLLAQIASPPALIPLILVAAWARLGAPVWSLAVPPLAAGSGERFSWQIDARVVAAEAAVLTLLSAYFAPVLLGALVVIPAIAAYWRYRLGGLTGDCLGASVEVTETILLLLIAARMA